MQSLLPGIFPGALQGEGYGVYGMQSRLSIFVSLGRIIEVMSMSTDVRINRSAEPRFPNMCVYSGEPNPDSHLLIVANAQSTLLCVIAPIFLLFGWYRVRVPIMKRHRAKYYLGTIGRDAALALASIVAYSPFAGLFQEDDPLRNYKVLGLLLLVAVPWILFEVLVPRCVDVEARGNWIEYSFKSHQYAERFRFLNSDHLLDNA